MCYPLENLCSADCMKKIIIAFIFIEGKDVHRCTSAANSIASKSAIGGGFMVIKIDNNHSNVIMKMTPYSLFDFLYVIISHLSLLCSLLNGSSNQSLCYSLRSSKPTNNITIQLFRKLFILIKLVSYENTYVK